MSGIIGLGMLFGIAVGGGALFAGYSILTALLLYASAGTLFVLVLISFQPFRDVATAAQLPEIARGVLLSFQIKR